MRSSHLALLLLALAPGAASAKAWQGITPGVSTQGDVSNRVGEPSTQGKLGGRGAVVYKGDQAIAGTRQAQFFLREDGTVVEITVFPSTQLDREAVEGTYGRSPQKTFTEDFRPVWLYRATGVKVFFGKEGFVEAISGVPGESSGTPARIVVPPAARTPAPPATAAKP